MADAGLEQARKTFERLFEGAQAAAVSLSALTSTVVARDASAMAFSYAKKASLDDAQALVHAKDMSDVIRLHCK
jgi:hypothetical protein